MGKQKSPLLFEQPQQQRQNRAQQQAGYNGEMKAEIALGIIDVAGQTAQSAFANPGPKQRANRRYHQAGNHQKFAHFVHVFKMVSEAREGNEGFLFPALLLASCETFYVFSFFLFPFALSIPRHVARLRY
jgi:hypothetical protein